MDHALVVEAHLVVDQEIMPLAGDRHVVIAIGPAFHGAAELLRRERGEAGEEIALGLLAAEGAPHATHLNRHGVGGNAEHMRNDVLDFARMLRRGMDRDVIVFARHGESDLTFEVEMLLAADPHRALQATRGRPKGCREIAALEPQRLGDEISLGAARLLDGDDGLKIFIGHLGHDAGPPARHRATRATTAKIG